jgi:hypothetical protein
VFAGRNVWCEAKWLVWSGVSMLWCLLHADERIGEQMAGVFFKNHFDGQQKCATLLVCPLWRNLYAYAPMADTEYVGICPNPDRSLYILYQAFSMAIGVVSIRVTIEVSQIVRSKMACVSLSSGRVLNYAKTCSRSGPRV